MKIVDFFNDKRYELDNYVYIIAEVSQNHDGSLGQAHAFIDACADTGVDAIKFQTHIADAESTPDEPFRVKFSYEDKTRYDYWKRMEFSKAQWIELKKHAEECGLEFLSSPFSVEAFDLLESIGVQAWKLGSGEVFNTILLEKMIQTRKPILFSSGMSTYEEISRQVKMVRTEGGECAIFQCTTAYPNSMENVGLNVVEEMQSRFDCPIGLSDHSGKIYPMLAAVALGARLLETHVTLSPYMFGPDVSSSLSIEKLQELVEGIRDITCMLNNPIDKTKLSESQLSLRHIFLKGIYARRDLSVGHVLSEDDIQMKKPLNGISAEDYKSIIGKRVKKEVLYGQPIREQDLEE